MVQMSVLDIYSITVDHKDSIKHYYSKWIIEAAARLTLTSLFLFRVDKTFSRARSIW